MPKTESPFSDISVLHLIDHMGLGGAQRAVGDQLKHRPNDRVFILNGKKKSVSIEMGGMEPAYTGAENVLEFLFLLPLLSAYLKKNQFQILHCHLRFSWLLGLLVKLINGEKIKVVFHERGWILASGFLYKTLVRFCAKKGVIVAISKNIALHLNKSGIPEDDIKIIYNGLETSNFFRDKLMVAQFRKRYGIPDQAYLIGFAGRFEKYKGWRDYLDSIALLSRESSDIYGMIAGSGPDLAQIVRYIKKLNLTSKIIIIGQIGDMVDYYNALDVFIFPSHFEPLGRVQLEAQACGVPVVASRVPGTIETVSNENAILVEPRDPLEIANAILRIRSNAGLARTLSESGKRNVRRFDYMIHLQEINTLYNEIIA